MITAMVVLPLLAILLVYRYNRAKLLSAMRFLTVLMNGCSNCKANLRMRGLTKFRPCLRHREHKGRIAEVRRAYA